MLFVAPSQVLALPRMNFKREYSNISLLLIFGRQQVTRLPGCSIPCQVTFNYNQRVHTSSWHWTHPSGEFWLWPQVEISRVGKVSECPQNGTEVTWSGHHSTHPIALYAEIDSSVVFLNHFVAQTYHPEYRTPENQPSACSMGKVSARWIAFIWFCANMFLPNLWLGQYWW